MNKKEKQMKSVLEFNKSRGDHIAVFLAHMFGSIKFLCVSLVLFLVWIAWNLNFLPGLKPFDPFPFTMLIMIVTLFSIILSVSVLINQKREGKMNNIRQQIEFEVNVHAEKEITKVLEMLHQIQKKMGINNTTDIELEEMKETLDIGQLHKQLNSIEENIM